MVNLIWKAPINHELKLCRGCGDVWAVSKKEIDFPMLRQIYLPSPGLPDINNVFGVDKRDRVYFYTHPLSRYDESSNELSSFCEFMTISSIGDICVSPQGDVLAINEIKNDFNYFDANGTLLIDGRKLAESSDILEKPEKGLPFWEIGGWGIDVNEYSFAVTGSPLNRVDHYSLDGKILRIIRSFVYKNRCYDFEEERPQKVCLDRWGRIWVSNGLRIFVFSSEGEAIYLTDEDEIRIKGQETYIGEWFGVDREGRLWSYSQDYVGVFEFPI